MPTYANTIDGNEILAKRSQCDYAGNDIQTTYATKTEVTTGLASKEDSSNKAQSINANSTTDFPSSKATADFVNSSVATNTAKFLGNFTLTDLSLTYPATDAQIETALDGYTFSPAPTNNDYVYVEIQDPQTPGVTDVVKRFKFDGANWLYEYSLNNSSFTAAEIAAIDSGITSTKVGNYDTHIADTTIHVTSTDKSTWNAKQDAISDLATIRSGAQAGATAVQPGDLSTVATTGAYSDLTGTPTIPTATSDLTNDSGFITLSDVPAQVNADWNSSSGASEILNKPTIPSGTQLVPAATSADADKVLTVNAQGTPAWASAQAPISAGTGIDITNNVVSVDTSVVATQTDLATKEDAFDVGTGLEMDTSGATPTLQVEAPVDIVAGPGIVVDNPDGNTLRVSQASNYEVELWSGTYSGNVSDSNYITLSELPSNFDAVEITIGGGYKSRFKFAGDSTTWSYMQSYANTSNTTIYAARYDISSAKVTCKAANYMNIGATQVNTWENRAMNVGELQLTRVVGIHRTASN